jgi:tetratricopeptide (TPR) repeat protein
MKRYAQAIAKTTHGSGRKPPTVAGDELMVISDIAEVMRGDQVVDRLPRGFVVVVRGFSGNKLKVCNRRWGAVSRDDLCTIEDATAKFEEEIIENRLEGEGYSLRGHALAFAGEFHMALADHNHAIRLNRSSSAAYHRRGLAFARNGQFDLAVRDFAEAIRLDPRNAEAVHDRGVAHRYLLDYPRAYSYFNEAISLVPDYTSAIRHRGITLQLLGDEENALKDFDHVIELDPDDEVARISRFLLLVGRGETERAEKDLLEAVRLNPIYLTAFDFDPDEIVRNPSILPSPLEVFPIPAR